MKLHFKSINRNGYSLQLIVNTDMKMYSIGYCLFNPVFTTSHELKSKKALRQLALDLKWQGYTDEDDLTK